MSEWFVTDDDCLQCCRVIPGTDAQRFEFVQINSYDGHIDGKPFFQTARGTIDMDDYSENEIQDMLGTYGYDERPEDRIIAEMFFETEVQEYVENEFRSWNAAVRRIAKITDLDLQDYLKQKKVQPEVKKIRIYDLDALFKEEGMEPFRYNQVAVFEGKGGVIVAESEANHMLEGKVTDNVIIPANPIRSPGKMWILPQYEATLPIDEIKTAPYKEQTIEEFFNRRSYNPRCEANYESLMDGLRTIGFDLHGYFATEKPSLVETIQSADERRTGSGNPAHNKESSLDR